MSDFDTFQHRWEISAKLHLITPLRIAGGQNAATYSLSQTPVLLSYDAQSQQAFPYIPGSSLKGVLRSTVERIVRTFNENEACISVSEDNNENVLCGRPTCISCSIFGSMDSGASIRVLDAHLSNEINYAWFLEERPHCATDHHIIDSKYVVTKVKKCGIQTPKTFLRQEEVVVANISFNLDIKLDNADEHHVGLILLALDEFNHKRCFIGGGVSRGYGFVDVGDINVIKKTLTVSESSFGVLEKYQDIKTLINSTKDYLRDIDEGRDVNRRDFDIYYQAHVSNKLDGHIVVRYKLKTLTDFQVPGSDESTVTNLGVPVIPGSVIKGFLRHRLINDGVEAAKIDEMFGSIKGNNQHRSRIIISDAFADMDFSGKDSIPMDTELTTWVVFDNITEDELTLIDDILTQKSVITGITSANIKDNSESVKNMVEFKAIGYDRFECKKYLQRK